MTLRHHALAYGIEIGQVCLPKRCQMKRFNKWMIYRGERYSSIPQWKGGMPDRIRFFMVAVKIMELNELNGSQGLATVFMLIEMINEVVKFNQLVHKMPGADDLKGNNKKDKLFHPLKVRFSA